MWSIRLRWLAVISFYIATVIIYYYSTIKLPYKDIWLVLITLAGFNLVYYIIGKLFNEFSLIAELVLLAIHIVIDLIFLTILVHYVGGVENPIYLFYIFHVVISSIVFPRWFPWLISSLVVIFFSVLVIVEFNDLWNHYCIFDDRTTHQNGLLVFVTLLIFSITVYVTTYICMTFMKVYRNSKRIIDHQNKKLLEADRQKMQFFRFASHELKSPIVSVKTTLDSVLMAFSGTMDDKAANLLKRASDRSGQMLKMIKELLEISQNKKDLAGQDKSEIDLIALIKKIIEQEKILAQQKRIRIKKEIAINQYLLMGIKEDFEKIFTNLIGNAVRYTNEDGLVSVIIQAEQNDLLFQVQDSGIGISEADQGKIFDEFYRSENAKKNVTYGTGLGLSLVKKLVNEYSGMISVQSELNKGSTFTVRFPKKQ